MADQNKSSRGPTNTVVDAIDESSFLTELERIGATAGRRTASYFELEQKIRREGKLLNKLIEEGQRIPLIKESPFYEQQVTGLRESIRNIRARMNSMESSAITKAESEASTYISRQFSQPSINTQIASIMRQSSVQNRAFTIFDQSYDQLEARREEILANIRQTERSALNEVKGMFGQGGQVKPESSAALGVIMSETQNRYKELATINVAQQLQRISGVDPTSRIRNIVEMGKEANRVLSVENVANELRQGGVNIFQDGQSRTIASENIQQEIINQARRLADTLKELSESAGKTDEELSKLRKTAEESAENMEKLQDAQALGGDGRRRPPTGVQIATFLSGAFGVASGAMQEIMINQRFGQVSNVAGFANLANEQYDMYRRGAAGDILSQLTLSQYAAAENMATEIREATKYVQNAQIASGVAQGFAGGLMIKEGLKDKVTGLVGGSLTGTSGIATEQIMTGTTNLVGGIATVGTVGLNKLRDVQEGQNALAAAQAQIMARQALMYIPATQLQGLRDYYVQLDIAAQGAGTRARQFLDQSMSIENMSAMSAARLSPEQFARLSQIGFEQIGSTFNVNQIFAARNLERAGFGSMQDNIQRMAMLANAGINNPKESMENILSAAMTKSLDSSKALNMMVENTAAMVQQSSTAMAAGVDVTRASAALLAGSVDPNMARAHQEFAISRAATAQEAMKDIVTDTSVSYTGMINVARIQKMTGISQIDSIFAAKLSPAEIKTMQNMDPKAAREALLDVGVYIGDKDVSTFLKQLLEAKTIQAVTTGAGALAYTTDEIRKNLFEGTVNKKEHSLFTEEEKAALGKMGSYVGLAGSEYYRAARGLREVNTDVGTRGMDIVAGKEVDDVKSQLDMLRTGGFKQAADAAESAARQFGKVSEALQTFIELQKKLETDGIRNEEAFSKAAVTMATDFKVSVGRFDVATTKYEKASQAILDGISAIKSNRSPIIPQAATDIMNTLKGKSAR